jgi:hypothetical protein
MAAPFDPLVATVDLHRPRQRCRPPVAAVLCILRWPMSDAEWRCAPSVGAFSAQPVRRLAVSLDEARAYACAYRIVSAGCLAFQFAAATNREICSLFRLFAADFSLFDRTLNPKVAGSNPARPI